MPLVLSPWTMFLSGSDWVSVSVTLLSLLSFLFTGREDSYPMDCTRGDPVQEVHLCQWCVELWDRHVGSHVLRREALLGHDQPRRTYLNSQCFSNFSVKFCSLSLNYNPTINRVVSIFLYLQSSIDSTPPTLIIYDVHLHLLYGRFLLLIWASISCLPLGSRGKSKL